MYAFTVLKFTINITKRIIKGLSAAVQTYISFFLKNYKTHKTGKYFCYQCCSKFLSECNLNQKANIYLS